MYDIKTMSIWKKEPMRRQNNEYLKSDVSELNLSVRSFNCLKRAGCNTIGDIIKIIDGDDNGLKKIRNLGSRSEKEILEKINEYREHFKSMELDGSIQKEKSDRELPVSRRRAMYSAEDVWNSNIEEWHLSNYALNGLKAHGIVYVKDLYATNPKDEPGWYAVRELFEKLPQC